MVLISVFACEPALWCVINDSTCIGAGWRANVQSFPFHCQRGAGDSYKSKKKLTFFSKLSKCEISQMFRAWPFFSVKTVKFLNSWECSFEKNGKQSARKLDARAVYMKWKTLFRPSGCIVPSLKMISISNCFRLKLAPEHLLRPLIAMSDRLWPGEFNSLTVFTLKKGHTRNVCDISHFAAKTVKDNMAKLPNDGYISK